MTKILPNLGLEHDVDGHIRNAQEWAIRRTIYEFEHGTGAVLNSSALGSGKTLVTAEVVYRMGLRRVLYIGIRDTFDQWASRLSDQSDGEVQLRKIDATAAGRSAFADFRAGVDGHYFSGSQYLSTQDWTQVPVTEKESGAKMFALDKKTGLPVVKPYKGVGPRSGPIWQTRRKQLRTYERMKPLDLIVYDEAHVAGNRTSNAIGTARSIPTRLKLALSGTWFGNKFVNAHTLTRWLWGEIRLADGTHLIDPRVREWTLQWCETETPTRRGGLPVTDPRGNEVKIVLGERVPGMFVATLPCYIQLESTVGLVPVPEILRVELTPAQRAAYDQMSEESLFWLQSHGDLEPVVASLPIVQRMRLRSATLGTMSVRPRQSDPEDQEIFYDAGAMESSKEWALASVLRRPDWAGKSVLIYTEDKRFVKALVARMKENGLSVEEWSGDVSGPKRKKLKAAFIAGEVQYLVAVISSIGTGTDGLQSICHRVVWLSESDSAKDNVQAIERVWRDGGNLAEFQHVKLVAVETVDEGVLVRNEAATDRARATMRAA